MRYVLVTLVMLVVGSAGAQAQTEKGRWTVGAQVGSLSYSGTGEPYSIRSFSISLSPSAGYFVARNLAIGASIPVTFLAYKASFPGTTVPSKVNSLSLGLAPFIRYYIGSAKLRPFASASYGYTQVWNTTFAPRTNNDSKNSSNYSTYSVGAGVAYFVNNTVSLDASLNYGDSFGYDRTTLNRGTTSLSVGFRLFFGK